MNKESLDHFERLMRHFVRDDKDGALKEFELALVCAKKQARREAARYLKLRCDEWVNEMNRTARG